MSVDRTQNFQTRRVDGLLAHYAASHQHPTNERIHFVAIPLIMLSLCGLIYSLHPYVLWIFLTASMVYYVRLGSRVFVAVMAAVSLVMLAVVGMMGRHVLPISLTVFVLAWVAQFVGHKLEGKKPSFFEDIQYLWVGPLFVLSKLLQRLGVTY